jgi:hypothetical protein
VRGLTGAGATARIGDVMQREVPILAPDDALEDALGTLQAAASRPLPRWRVAGWSGCSPPKGWRSSFASRPRSLGCGCEPDALKRCRRRLDSRSLSRGCWHTLHSTLPVATTRTMCARGTMLAPSHHGTLTPGRAHGFVALRRVSVRRRDGAAISNHMARVPERQHQACGARRRATWR